MVIPKKDKTPRFCTDYRRLNLITKKDSYPLPRMDEYIDSLGDAKVLTTIYCNAGYWQIPVAEEDIPKTAFVCHAGVYEFLRMPFGLSNAPATFQLAIDIILSGVKWKHCLVYLYDVIVFSRNMKDHVKHVDEVLGLLQQAEVTLRLRKCAFFQRTVEYLGHQITPGKLGVSEGNTRALRDADFPRTQTQLKS